MHLNTVDILKPCASVHNKRNISQYDIFIYQSLYLTQIKFELETNNTMISKKEFESLSEVRFRLRSFERFSEDIVKAHNITPLQYLLLLHIKGYPNREYATVGEIAVRLQAKHNSVVALISRCVALGFVQRKQSDRDKREVEVSISKEGEKILTELAALHRKELQSLSSVFPVLFVSS